MKTLSRRTSTGLLARLIEVPDLARMVRALPGQRLATLVREIGVEDAGPIVALASTEQIVAMFDEDLFVGDAAGEREVLDRERFVTWLEVLLEAGDAAAAQRFAQLSEDFVAHALSSVILVFDHEQLRGRLIEDDPTAEVADKALEAALSEEIDGYLLVARGERGWDAVMALVLALDRYDRAALVRALDRCVALNEGYVDDLEGLTDALSAAESLAEDVEAEREERRAAKGFVEARAAKSFLALARAPLETGAAEAPRDAVTRGYFRDLERAGVRRPEGTLAGDPGALGRALAALPAASVLGAASASEVVDGLRALGRRAPDRFGERLEELAYLANVLLAGAGIDGRRFEPAEAAEAALATVALGAELEARRRRGGGSARATPDELVAVLDACPADVLFRDACSTALDRGLTADPQGLVRSRAALDEALGRSEGSAPPT